MNEIIPLVRIVDDDASFRESHQILLELEGFEVVAYPEATTFLEQDDLTRPGCVLLDIRMPGLSGLDVQEELNRVHSLLPVLFLTGHADVKTAVHALKAGAADFLEKSSSPDVLIATVRAACLASVEEAQKREADNRFVLIYESLTPREREVLRLTIQGLQIKEVAQKLGLSPLTVKMHRTNAFLKLGVRTPLEAFQWFQELPEAYRKESAASAGALKDEIAGEPHVKAAP